MNVEYKFRKIVKKSKKYRQVVLVNDQLDAQFFFVYTYSNSLHVSSTHVLIIRRTNCINTTSGICNTM